MTVHWKAHQSKSGSEETAQLIYPNIIKITLKSPAKSCDDPMEVKYHNTPEQKKHCAATQKLQPTSQSYNPSKHVEGKEAAQFLSRWTFYKQQEVTKIT